MEIEDRLEEETENQIKFREDMENAGIEIRIYSGRGMYGRGTYGVSCGQFPRPTEHEVYSSTKVRLRSDTLGRGSILYVG